MADAAPVRINPARVAVDVIAGVLILAGIIVILNASTALNKANLALYYRGGDTSPAVQSATFWLWAGIVMVVVGVVMYLVRLLAAAVKS